MQETFYNIYMYMPK